MFSILFLCFAFQDHVNAVAYDPVSIEYGQPPAFAEKTANVV